MTAQNQKAITIIGVMLLLLLAFAARLHNLDSSSFWYDEGVAYGHATRSIGELIPRLRDNVHVPAYFGSLALYENLVGSSEFALRSWSVWFSLISVAATYALGKRLFGNVAGIAATVFLALNTFSIYYAQEARMYAMLAAAGTLSMWVFVGFVRHLSQRDLTPERNRSAVNWALALALLNTWGEYTHISYALVMLSQGVLAVLWLIGLLWDDHRQKDYRVFLRALIVYTGANVLTIALFLPWLGTAISQIGAQPNISAAMSNSAFVQMVIGRFAVGLSYQQTIGGMVAILYFLLVFSLVQRGETRPRATWRTLVPMVWVGVSVGLYWQLGLFDRYFRFLLPAQIGFALILAHGVSVLWSIMPPDREAWRIWVARVAAVGAVVTVSVTMLEGLPYLYRQDLPQNFVRDDYRSLAATIEREADSDDAIIVTAPGTIEIFRYYYEGDLPIFPLPASDDTQGDTQAIIAQYDRIYAVVYGAAEQDPDTVVLGTLNTQAYPLTAEWIDQVQLLRFATPTTFNEADPVAVQFGDHITLERLAISETTLSPNEVLQLQLEWSTDARLNTRYKIFLQLLDETGAVVAQRDSEPLGGRAITTVWEVDMPFTDHHALLMPSDLPTGDYRLILGLYDLNDPLARLPVGDSTYYDVATITLE